MASESAPIPGEQMPADQPVAGALQHASATGGNLAIRLARLEELVPLYSVRHGALDEAEPAVQGLMSVLRQPKPARQSTRHYRSPKEVGLALKARGETQDVGELVTRLYGEVRQDQQLRLLDEQPDASTDDPERFLAYRAAARQVLHHVAPQNMLTREARLVLTKRISDYLEKSEIGPDPAGGASAPEAPDDPFSRAVVWIFDNRDHPEGRRLPDEMLGAMSDLWPTPGATAAARRAREGSWKRAPRETTVTTAHEPAPDTLASTQEQQGGSARPERLSWDLGQLDQAIDGLRSLVDTDLDAITRGRILNGGQIEMVKVLTSGRSKSDIAAYLAMTEAGVNSAKRRLVTHARNRIEAARMATGDPELFEGALPEPGGYSIDDRWQAPPGIVGQVLRARLEAGRVEEATRQIAERTGLGFETIRRFFSGRLHPLPERILLPVMEALGIGRDSGEGRNLLGQYDHEGEQIMRLGGGAKGRRLWADILRGRGEQSE